MKVGRCLQLSCLTAVSEIRVWYTKTLALDYFSFMLRLPWLQEQVDFDICLEDVIQYAEY